MLTIAGGIILGIIGLYILIMVGVYVLLYSVLAVMYACAGVYKVVEWIISIVALCNPRNRGYLYFGRNKSKGSKR